MTDHRSTYLANLASALRGGGARELYFPPDKELRHERNLRLGREVGYGLRDGADLGGLYSRLVVVNSLDSTGVCVDAAEFLDAVREGMTKAKGETNDE